MVTNVFYVYLNWAQTMTNANAVRINYAQPHAQQPITKCFLAKNEHLAFFFIFFFFCRHELTAVTESAVLNVMLQIMITISEWQTDEINLVLFHHSLRWQHFCPDNATTKSLKHIFHFPLPKGKHNIFFA